MPEQDKKEILTIDDVKLLVDDFYNKVREDALLGPVFNEKIGERWPAHLDKMYRFWQTILLDQHTYHGSPFKPHADLPIDKEHFDQWLVLFDHTVTEHFSGEKAEEAQWRASKMAELFNYKIQYMKDNPGKVIL
jgi:hemoglobin